METLLIEKIAYLKYVKGLSIMEIQDILLIEYNIDLMSTEIIKLLSVV